MLLPEAVLEIDPGGIVITRGTVINFRKFEGGSVIRGFLGAVFRHPRVADNTKSS